MSFARRAALSFAVSTIVVTAASARPAAAEGRACIPMRGVIETTITTDGCASAVGLCTAGHVRGGFLHGATTFAALGAAPSAGMPNAEAATTMSYAGALTIATRFGNLQVRDLGVLDGAAGVFSELDRVTGGTGAFAHASGVFFVNGTQAADGSGFRGDLSGEVCFP